MSLRVGHAVAHLDVARGSSLVGYAARTATVSGVLDPLEVGAVAFLGSSPAVVCVADLLQVDGPLATSCREAVASAVATTPDLVWMTGTHTHAGPSPQAIADQVVAAAVAAAREAVATAVPAQVTLHRAELDGVGGQRTGTERRTTVPVDVLRVGSSDGSPLGLVGVVPVHPTVLSAGNSEVSADLPGAVRRAVEAGDVWSLVPTGAAGDISTRPHRRDQTPEEVDRLGRLVSQRLIDATATDPIAEADDVVGGTVVETMLAPADPGAPFRKGALEAASAALADAEAFGDPRRIRDATVALQGAQLGPDLDPDAEAVTCATSYLDLGGVRLLGLGGEPFLDLALTVTADDPAVALIGYANGYAGYLPTRAAFERVAAHPESPEYEVLIARVAPGEPERALEVLRLLRSSA
jgi:neutral ceramidase